MSDALFFRLVTERDKVKALQSAVSQVNAGGPPAGAVFSADPETFSQIPGSPFAYWASERIRRLFAELPPFEGNGRSVRQGLSTTDDFRFVRAWWEVPPAHLLGGTRLTTRDEYAHQTRSGKRWVTLAKGGDFSPYYGDLPLVIDWLNDGAGLKAWVVSNPSDSGTTHWSRRIPNSEHYFCAGLTWSLRTTSDPSFRVLPAGCVFSHKGPAIITDAPALWLGVLQSSVFRVLIGAQVGAAEKAARSYEVGLVQRCPVPDARPRNVVGLVERAVALQRAASESVETSRLFVRPGILRVEGTLRERVLLRATETLEREARLQEVQSSVDQAVCEAYGLSAQPQSPLSGGANSGVSLDEDDNDRRDPAPTTSSGLMTGFLSYSLGCVLGRWDLRVGISKRILMERSDPFDPLPPCSSAMLIGTHGLYGLPAGPEDVPLDYPIPIQWDGIIPDDDGHPSDLVSSVRRVFACIVPERDPLETEAEVCGALKAQSLRAWFANDFFPYHLKQYSKSRRKAPIYWQLQSASKSYSIWLYYHRITGDTLWKVLSDYVEPKIEHERRMLGELESKVAQARAAGNGPREREVGREIERQKALLEELAQFRADIREVAEMGYQPDRDDGVIINIAPLHKLVPWPEAAAMWKELLEGKYPWSTMSTRIREWRAKSK